MLRDNVDHLYNVGNVDNVDNVSNDILSKGDEPWREGTLGKWRLEGPCQGSKCQLLQGDQDHETGDHVDHDDMLTLLLVLTMSIVVTMLTIMIMLTM